MYKKIFVSFIFLTAITFSFSICFANDAGNMIQNAGDNVRNVVGGVENTIEDSAKDVSNTSKDITADMENGANNVANSVTNDNNNTDNKNSMIDQGRDGAYTATRTSTDGTANTFMGMDASTWTWLIIGIAAIAIVAMVWYYAVQTRSSNYDNKD